MNNIRFTFTYISRVVSELLVVGCMAFDNSLLSHSVYCLCVLWLYTVYTYQPEVQPITCSVGSYTLLLHQHSWKINFMCWLHVWQPITIAALAVITVWPQRVGEIDVSYFLNKEHPATCYTIFEFYKTVVRGLKSSHQEN